MNEDPKLEAFKKEMATVKKIVNEHISTNPDLASFELDTLVLKEKNLGDKALEAFTSESSVRCCNGHNQEVLVYGTDVCVSPYRDLPCK